MSKEVRNVGINKNSLFISGLLPKTANFMNYHFGSVNHKQELFLSILAKRYTVSKSLMLGQCIHKLKQNSIKTK